MTRDTRERGVRPLPCGARGASRHSPLAPGNPSIEAQEKRDRVPRATYRVLVANGSLRIAEGLRVTTPGMLHAAAVEAFGVPERIIHDRFLVAELKDAVRGTVKLVERIPRWSDSDFDIRALRKLALDGPLAVAPSARPLLTASLAAALVKNDGGLSRMVKKDTNNCGRDDVAAALVLAAGSLQRNLAHTGRRGGMVYHGMVGQIRSDCRRGVAGVKHAPSGFHCCPFGRTVADFTVLGWSDGAALGHDGPLTRPAGVSGCPSCAEGAGGEARGSDPQGALRRVLREGRRWRSS